MIKADDVVKCVAVIIIVLFCLPPIIINYGRWKEQDEQRKKLDDGDLI